MSKLSSSIRVKTLVLAGSLLLSPLLCPKGSGAINQILKSCPLTLGEIRVALMEPAVPMSHDKRLMALPRPCHAVRPEEKTARPNQLQVDLTQSAVDRVLMYVSV